MARNSGIETHADMINLTSLDEETMMENLRARFADGEVYTTCGHIVVSVNPFRWLPMCMFDEKMVEKYHAAEDPFATEAPHCYSIAHEALTDIGNQASRGLALQSHSILVSGESGAGKTEATKICMRYLAHVDSMSARGTSSGAGVLTDRILKTNPILEAIGNAQTVRNDNSSRFGKFLRLRYSPHARQLGAHIDTYLLERSRVVRPPEAEANYHVLYAIVHAPDTTENLQGLKRFSPDHYPCLTPGNERQTAAMRSKQWSEISAAMAEVGFTAEQQSDVGRALAATLALTLLQFTASDDSEGNRCASVVTGEEVQACASLIDIDVASLGDALCTRRSFLPTGDSFVKPLNEDQAQDGRDALAKALYGRLFDKIVAQLNALIEGDDAVSAAADAAFIGILDIFGFESFKTNSFEQLCINFANEMLQQQFNADVFRQQQKEYEAEGVPWQSIEYQDNEPTLELIRGKRTGILSLLDEECRLQSGTAAAFVQKLMSAHPKSELLSMPKMQLDQKNPVFTVSHYAGKVTYDTALFLTKNTDPLHPELVEMMQASGSAALVALFASEAKAAAKPTGGAGGARQGGRGALFQQTVGGRFKEQLGGLMTSIASTQVHYIRCVKPNAQSVPHEFTKELVAEQLRCAGMLEAVRISRAAYPHRLPRLAVAKRFGHLVREEFPGKKGADVALKALHAANEPKFMTTVQLRECLRANGGSYSDSDSQETLCEKVEKLGREGLHAMLAMLLPPTAELTDGGFCVGKTKVFFKASQLPTLETRLLSMRTRRVLKLQAHARRIAAAAFYRRAKKAIPKIQSAARRRAGRRAMLRRLAAAHTIGRIAKGWVTRKRVREGRRCSAAVVIEASYRGNKQRRQHLKRQRAAKLIQSFARMQYARRWFADKVEKARLQATYKGQLEEAKQRLASEANEREGLLAEKQRLEAMLSKAESSGAVVAQLQSEKQEKAKEFAMLLEQQEAELASLREELSATAAAKASEEVARIAAEKKAEEAQIKLSVEQSNHMKLQRVLELEKSQHSAAKGKLKQLTASLPDGAEAELSQVAAAGLVPMAQHQAVVSQVQELEDKNRELRGQLQDRTTKLTHSENEREREKHKLQRTIDAAQLKRREWEGEKRALKRQLENQEAEVRKRDKWLEKAKDIIKEYQKRHAPGGGPATPGAS